jgi:broad specificity phosphatase PhoE
MRFPTLDFRSLAVAATLLLAIPQALAQQTIIILRHAEQTLVGGMMDGDPPLNETGQRRAEQLKSLLGDAAISAIYASQYTRAQQTVEPLSRAIGRDIHVVPKDDLIALAAKLRSEHGGQIVLVVAHSDTIPKLLAMLGHLQSVEIGRTEFNSLWLVVPRAEGPPLVSRLRL